VAQRKRPLRILHLGINYWPDETGIAPFATGRCEYLAAQGHEVIACTGFPYYPQWRVPDHFRGSLFSRDRRGEVTILRSWMYVPRRLTSLRRVLHEGSFLCSSFLRAISTSRPDLLFVTSPPLGLAVSAIALSRLWRVPYVLHVADLQPDTAVDLGMLPQGQLTRALYRLESVAYCNAALVSTLTEAMRSRIIAKGIPAEKVVLFSDWVDPQLFTVAPPEASRGATDSRFIVSHFGNMGVKQGLEVVLEAARLSVDDPGIVYLLVGDGAARNDLEAKARELDLPNLRFLPLQPRERFLELLAQSDACLITQRCSVADIVFPSKVITLLAAARPIVASVGAGSEVARVVADSGGGIMVPPENPRALADAVARLHSDPCSRMQMGHAGRSYALGRWERETVLKSTERALMDITGGREQLSTAADFGLD